MEYISSPYLPMATFPVLTTPRLVLREIQLADLPGIVPISFYQGKLASSVAEAARFRELINERYQRGDGIHWGLALRDTDEVVGTAGLYRGFADETGELGYVLLEAHRRRGLMREAAAAIVRFGFTELRLRQVVAYTGADNQPSMAVLRGVGFKEQPDTSEDSRKFVWNPLAAVLPGEH